MFISYSRGCSIGTRVTRVIRVAQSKSAIDFGCFSGVLRGGDGGGIHSVMWFHFMNYRYNEARLCLYQTMLLQTKIFTFTVFA